MNREGLLETPARVARMCRQIYGGLARDPEEHLKKQFVSQSSQMVVEKDITFILPVSIICCPSGGKPT